MRWGRGRAGGGGLMRGVKRGGDVEGGGGSSTPEG